MKRTQIIAASVLVLSLVTAGTVAGQTTSAKAETAVSRQTEKSLESSSLGIHKRGGKHRGMSAICSEEMAKLLGMTQDELKEALKSGTTLSELAAAKGVEKQKVIEVLSTAMGTRIDEKVKAGDLSKEEGDALKASFAAKAEQIVDGKLFVKGGKHAGAWTAGMQEVTKLLGVTQEELFSSYRAGKSLAEIAAEKGVERQKVVDLLAKQMESYWADEQKAGRLTQEQYNTLTANLKQKAEKLVDKKFSGHKKSGKHGHGKWEKKQSNSAVEAEPSAQL